MKIKELNKLYYSHHGNCRDCGCELEDNSGIGLGNFFVLDKNGNFYCMNCDRIFEDADERIYEPDLYPEYEYDEDHELI